MKRELSKYISLLLVLLLCLSLVCCNGSDQPVYEFDYEGDLTPGTAAPLRRQYRDKVYVGKGVPTFDYTEAEASELMVQLDELYECLEQDDPAAFVAMFTYVQYGAFARMESQCSLAQLEYSLYRNDPEAAENFEWMNAFYTDASARLFKLYRLAYDSPFCDTFFRGWDEEDIRMALLFADAMDEEYAALQQEYDDVLVSYYEMQQSENFIEESAKLYADAVRINNAVARKLGYENYMDYAYEFMYLREYTPEDVDAVRAYVKQHLIPLYKRVDAELTMLESDLRQSEIDAINALMYPELEDESVQTYMQAVGGDFSEEYAKLMEQERYCLAYDPSASRDGAFTDCLRDADQPYIYMGGSYINGFTLIHEYGHYYAFSVDALRAVSYDLCELQSQGNEWLYLAYLSEQHCDLASTYTALYRMYSDIGSIILCLAVDEFEQTVYANPEAYADPATLDALFTQILSGYIDPGAFGAGIEEYWHYVAFDTAGYYVSYAVSMISCLELYYMAEDDLGKAMQTYLSLSEYKGEMTFSEVLENAGMQNPLESDYVFWDFDELYMLMQQKQQ